MDPFRGAGKTVKGSMLAGLREWHMQRREVAMEFSENYLLISTALS